MTVIGTAGWSIGSQLRDRFVAEGSGLQRYASVLDGVEINSSFYRRHKRETWQRWADSVPDSFRFAVKLPKTISHDRRLVDSEAVLTEFLADIEQLGHRLGPLLVQTPPSLDFNAECSGAVVVEPRHVGWASDAASALLVTFGVSRVVADPSLPELLAAAQREAFLYLRLHGAPRIYYSAYDKTAVGRLAVALVQPSARNGWCIFDNTASGAALGNALELRDALGALRDGNLAASGSFDEFRSTQG
jgi:uncharacterized protein YecE (DUF72 family)